MSYHPITQMALARSRQDDLLREAERHRLASEAHRDEPGLRARLAAFLRRRDDRRAEAPRVAPAAK
jgi:hypothetical protein